MCCMALVIHLAKVFAANCPFALLYAVKLYVFNGVLCYVSCMYFCYILGEAKGKIQLSWTIKSINQSFRLLLGKLVDVTY